MTYYKVKNLLTGTDEFFVPDETTKENNSHLVCIVGSETDAQNKALQNKAEFETNQEYLFVLSIEIVTGNNTVWRSVDLDNDLEEGNYKVFNHTTGQYEDYPTKTTAVAKMTELKQTYFSSFDFTVTSVEVLPEVDGKYSKEKYGTTVGEIPVEVM